MSMTKKEKIEHILQHADEAFIVEHKMKGLLKNLVKSLNAKQVDAAYDQFVHGPARAAAAAAAAATAAAERAESDTAAAEELAEQRAARAAAKAEEAAAKALAAARAEREEDSSWASRAASEKIAKLRAEAGELARRRGDGSSSASAASSAAEAALAAAAAIAECGLAGLPAECTQAVRAWLDPVSALRLGMTCSRLRAAVLLEPSGWDALDMRALEPSLRTDDALGALAALAQGSLASLACPRCPLLSRGMVAGIAQANAQTLRSLRAPGLSGGSAWSAEQLAALQEACPALAQLAADVWVERLTPAARRLLAPGQRLTAVGLKVRNAGSADAAEAGELVSGAPWLQYLVLEGSSSTALGADGALAFAAALRPPPPAPPAATNASGAGGGEWGLARLDCPRAYMLDEGVRALCASLGAMGCLQQLSLPSNTIRAPAAEAIRAMCALPGCALDTLDLRYNEIGAIGAPHMGELLRTNRSLTELDLRFNGIDNVGIIALAEGLEANGVLRRLDLTGNLCQIGGAERLGEALAVNSTLRTLELDSNRLTAKGGAALAAGLLKNTGLRKLTVGGNAIKAGAKKFASALQVNKTLEWLELGANGIDDDGCDEISWAVAGTCMLTHLVRARPPAPMRAAGAAARCPPPLASAVLFGPPCSCG